MTEHTKLEADQMSINKRMHKLGYVYYFDCDNDLLIIGISQNVSGCTLNI